MTDLINEFKEFAKGLQLSDYELFFCAAVLVSYPKTAPHPRFDIDADNAVFLEVNIHGCKHELTISASYIAYVNNILSVSGSHECDCTEYDVIEAFYKAIQ